MLKIFNKIILQAKKFFTHIMIFSMDKSNPYFLDFPIDKSKNDYIGFEAQTDAIFQSIKNDAKIIGIIADYGSGKSSLVNLLKEKLSKWRYKIIKINLWDVEKNENNPKEAIPAMHEKFLFQLTSQLKRNNLIHLTRKLNSNYSNVSISVKNKRSYIFFFLSIFLFTINYLNKNNLLYYLNFLPLINAQWLEPYFKEIANLSGILALIFIIISVISSDIVFSLFKATPEKRTISECDTLEMYLDIIKSNIISRKKIIVIEDLDRIKDDKNIKLFLEQIYTFYGHSSNKKIVFIIALKSQDYFDKIEEHYKIFDYTVDLKKIQYSDLQNIFLELLKSKEKIVKIKYGIDFSDDNAGDWMWLAQGKELNIRQLKHRYNEALLNYVTLTNRFSEKKSINIKSCIAFSYLKNEYPKLYCLLIKEDVFADDDNFSDLKKLINAFIEHKYTNKDDLWKNVSSDFSIENSDVVDHFKQDVFDLIRNEYISDNFEMYAYNFPKTNNIFTLAEETFHHNYLYNKNINNLDEIINEILDFNKDFIQSTVKKAKKLNKLYPDFIFGNEKLFENIYTNANNDDKKYILSNMLKINSQTSKKTFDRLIMIKDYQVVDNNFIIDYIKNIKEEFREENDDASICNFRYELLSIFNNYTDLFNDLYIDEFPNPSQKEYDLIKDFSLATKYLNYRRLDSSSIDNISYFINNYYTKDNFNELMGFMEELNLDQFHQLLKNLKIFDKFNEDNKEKIITNFEEYLNLDNWDGLINAINIFNYLSPYLEKKLIYQVEENLVSKEIYCDLINELKNISDITIEFISNPNFGLDYPFNESIQELCYFKGYYITYLKSKILFNNEFKFESDRLNNLENSYLELYNNVDLYNKFYKYLISCNELLNFYKLKKIYSNCSEDYLMPFSFVDQNYDMLNYIINEIDNTEILNEYILNVKFTILNIEEWEIIINKYADKLVKISSEAHLHFKELLPSRNLKNKINAYRKFRRNRIMQDNN